jgi:hypothetical protein
MRAVIHLLLLSAAAVLGTGVGIWASNSGIVPGDSVAIGVLVGAVSWALLASALPREEVHRGSR